MSTLQGLEISILGVQRIPSDAETVSEMQIRGLAFWTDNILPLAKAGESGTVAIVSHGAFCECTQRVLSIR